MFLYRKNKSSQKHEKGQIIVIMALLFIGLVAVVGLAVDLGYMFVSYSRLRRAVDSAALAATSQFREGYSVEKLIQEANQFLDLNGIVNPVEVRIETCETNPGDPDLCTTPARKLVRVLVTEDVPMFFLSVIGIHSAPITVYAISEAASVDLVLLIDTSTSMAQANGRDSDPKICNQPESDPNGGEDLSDGSVANPLGLMFPGECHPFEEIKKAAILLTRRLFLAHDGNAGYDRVSIVTFDRFPKVQLELTDQQTIIEDTIRNLSVYQGSGPCAGLSGTPSYLWDPSTFDGPCRLYDAGGSFIQMWSSTAELSDGTFDPRGWMGTNSGGGLKVAGNVLGGSYPGGFSGATPPTRETALWVVVWLTDGYTNAGFENDGASDPETTDNAGTPLCPRNTWVAIAPNGNYRFCVDQDARPVGRHTSGDVTNYDPDDYARDMVDFVTNPDTDPVTPGQGALLFTIGLGNKITDKTQNEIDHGYPAPGETLLRYGAEKGGGFYYPAPNANQLDTIFLAIANKIATRLSR